MSNLSSHILHRIASHQATATRSLSSKSTTLSYASLVRTPEPTSSRCDTTRPVLSYPALFSCFPLLPILSYPILSTCAVTALCCAICRRTPKGSDARVWWLCTAMLCYICRISIHKVSRNLFTKSRLIQLILSSALLCSVARHPDLLCRAPC